MEAVGGLCAIVPPRGACVRLTLRMIWTGSRGFKGAGRGTRVSPSIMGAKPQNGVPGSHVSPQVRSAPCNTRLRGTMLSKAVLPWLSLSAGPVQLVRSTLFAACSH